jgi:pimeloyl-ACP methyl ester carboxylesterase
MARIRNKHPVVLVHGVKTKGKWQDDLFPLLSQCFEPVIVRYPQYTGLIGGLLVVCEPWVLLLVAVLSLLVWWLGWLPVSAVGVAGLALCLFAFLPGAVEVRRRLAMRTYKRATAGVFRKAPHLIAHSFGTYLTVRVLAQLPAAAFRRVILCGSVLRRDFDWFDQIVAGKVDHVRSDFTQEDPVCKAAGVAGMLHSNLGDAGAAGMDLKLKGIHRLNTPRATCPRCVAFKMESTIHDVDCSGMGHSDGLLTSSHVRSWWLPFLWGFDPGEHGELLKLCRKWIDATDRLDWATTARIERQLSAQRWRWCNGESMWFHLEQAMMSEGLSHSKDEVILAFNRLAHRLEASRMCDDDDPNLLYLQPNYALFKVLEPQPPSVATT